MNDMMNSWDQNEEELSETLSLTLSILDEMGKAGLLVVPNMPTGEMLRAGAIAGDTDIGTAMAVYDAMTREEEKSKM